MADSGVGVLVLLVGLVSLFFPQVPFHLEHFALKDAEMSEGGRTLYRLLGAVVSLIGFGMILW